MKSKAACLLITVLLLNARAFSQQPESTQWLSDSSRSIQFGVGSSFFVHAFDSKSISFKGHLSAGRALRIGVSLSGSTEKWETHRTTFSNDSLVSSTYQSGDPTHSLNVEALAVYLWYFDTNSDVYLFLGAGPLAGYSRTQYTGRYSDLTKSWSVGVAGTIGIEWFVHRRISLHAEYQASGQYTHSLSNSTDVDYSYSGGRVETENRSNRWSMNSERVLFGFSAYF